VEQFLSDRTHSGEQVLSLAPFEGERKLTQLEIIRPALFFRGKTWRGEQFLQTLASSDL
jgi:hypothetical protein